MIKCITLTRHINEAAEFERLASFFDALRAEPCHSLDESGVSNRQFLAPCGILKLVHPEENTQNSISSHGSDIGHEVYIEVTSLDSIRQVIQTWLDANPS